VTALVQVEVIEDLLQEFRVITSELHDTGLNFGEQVLNGLLDHSSVLFFGDLPSGLHHADEVFITGNTHRKVTVVVIPLLFSDFAVMVTLGTFEVAQKVSKDLLTSLSTLKELRVH